MSAIPALAVLEAQRLRTSTYGSLPLPHTVLSQYVRRAEIDRRWADDQQRIWQAQFASLDMPPPIVWHEHAGCVDFLENRLQRQ
jgi:hypothetical protein